MFATYPVLACCASQLLLDLRAAQGMPGLELSCGVLVGTSRKECAVQQGTWAGTWMRWGGMQGVTRSQCAGEHLEEILKQGDGQRKWKKVGSRRWGIEKGSKGEEKRGVMLPVQMMLPGFSWDQEPGSGGWQNCWANSTWGVKWEQKICWVEPGQGEQAWDEAKHRDPAAMLSLRALPSLPVRQKYSLRALRWATKGVRSSCFLWGDRYTSSWGKASGCSKACLGCPLSKHTLCRGPQRRAPGRKEQAPCKPPPGAWLGATMVTTKLLAGGDRQKPLGGCSVMELSTPPGVCACAVQGFDPAATQVLALLLTFCGGRAMPWPSQLAAAVSRCGTKSRMAWACHGAGQWIHQPASLAGSQILFHTCPPFPPLPSAPSLPLTISCLSLYPFLNYCLCCALKMQCAVWVLSVFIVISSFSFASLTLSSLTVVASRENVWAYIIYSCVRVITEVI